MQLRKFNIIAAAGLIALNSVSLRSVAQTVLPPQLPASMDGAWLGSLDLGAMKLRIVFHIVTTPSGLTATLDSPDQGATGIPTTSVQRTGDALTIKIDRLRATYEGKLSPDHATLTGTFAQGGQPFPLTLTLAKDQASLERKRPQNPTKPYPYRSEDLTYTNAVQHDTLAATITIPPGKGPFPAVLLITGSGPQDRDETLLGHKPFLVLSDYLTRHGIVVLRADDRGTAKSTGDFASATTADFATDAEAGLALLKSRPEVDPRRIGLIGHSEGAIIAPMVAARSHDVAFIVMLAGSGLPGDQIIVEQLRLISIANGATPEQAQAAADEQRQLLTLVETEKDPAALDKKIREQLAGQIPPSQLDGQIHALTSPWYRYFLTYDPAPALRQLRIPVLALAGSKDLQVPPAQNLGAIRTALATDKDRHVEVDELPGLNHLFQTATTGSPSEYADIEETIAPVALEKIATWISSLPPLSPTTASK